MEAAERVADYYRQTLLKSYIVSSLKVSIPDGMRRTEQIRYLEKIEKAAIMAVKAKLEADIVRLRPFEWDTGETRAQKWSAVVSAEQTVRRWEAQARADADSHVNWLSEGGGTHRFYEGNAYHQLKSIAASGWGRN